MSDKKYLSGLYGSKKHERAPDFVICKLKIKPKLLIDSLSEFKDMDGYLSMQIKTPYSEDPDWPDRLVVEIDNRQSEPKNLSEKKGDDFDDDDIPF